MKDKKSKLLATFNITALFNDRGLLCSFISISAGLIAGAVITDFSKSNIKNEILSLFISFNTEFADKSKMEIFSGILLSGLLYFFALVISGSNIFGKELSLLITALKASGITSLISFFYSQYALRGFEYCILVFFPGKIIFISGMLFMTKCCYDFSKLLRTGFREEGEAATFTGLFSLKALFSLLIFILSWLTDFLCIIIYFQGYLTLTNK